MARKRGWNLKKGQIDGMIGRSEPHLARDVRKTRKGRELEKVVSDKKFMAWLNKESKKALNPTFSNLGLKRKKR